MRKRVTIINRSVITIKKFAILSVAVDGQVINWIESKALFGDYEVHRGYLNEQL